MMMIVLKTVLVGCVWVSVWPAWCVCFSRGASSSSCVDMKPGHISAQPPLTNSAVTIHTSRSIYLPQHTLMVSVRSSRAFMGLLLQARSVPEDRVVGGQFMLYPLGTQTLSCVSTADTITHSNKLLKRNLSFSWRAPAQPSGDLRFYITVVHSYFVYWERIRSAVVYDGTRRNQSPDYDAKPQIRMISASLMKPTDRKTSSVALLFNSTQSINIYTNAPPTHTSPAAKETYSGVTHDGIYDTTLKPCTLTHHTTHTGAFKLLRHLTHPHTTSDTHTTTTHTPMHTELQEHVYTQPQKTPVRTHTYTTMPSTPTHSSPPLTPHTHTSHTLPKKGLTTPNSYTHEDRWLVAHILAKHQRHSGAFTQATTATTHPDQQREAITGPSTPALISHLHPPSPFLKSSSSSISQLIPTSVQSPILIPVPTSPPGPTPLPPSILIPDSTQTTDLNLTLIPRRASIPTSNSISLQPLHSILTPTSVPTPNSIPIPESKPTPNSIPIPASNLNLTLHSMPTKTSIPFPNSILNLTPASTQNLNSTSTLSPISISVPAPTPITVPRLIPILNQITKPNLSLIPIPAPTATPNLTSTSTPTLNPITPQFTIPNTPLNLIPTPTSVLIPISKPTTAPTPITTFSLTPVSIPPSSRISIPYSILSLTTKQLSNPTPILNPSSTLTLAQTSPPTSTVIPVSIPVSISGPTSTSIPNYTSSQSILSSTSSTQTHLLTSTPLHSSTVPSSPHPDPSPALQRSLLNPVPDRESQADQPQKKEGPSESSPPQRPREQPRAPDEKGVKPDLVPRHKASELGLLLLLGLSAGLGMAVAVGLRYLQRKHCRRRTAMSLGDQSHGNSGVIHVQECGDLVQVRRIRENSFLLLQAEYNLITAPGS